MKLAFIPERAIKPLMFATLGVSGAIVAIASHFNRPPWLFAAVAVFGLFYLLLLEHNRRAEGSRRDAAVVTAVAQLDAFAHGRRWVGRETRIVLRMADARVLHGLIRTPLLCKTGKGDWFVIEIVTSGDRVTMTEIHPLDQEQAAEILSHNPDILAAEFNNRNGA